MSLDSFNMDYNGSLVTVEMRIDGNIQSDKDIYLKGIINGDVSCGSRLFVNRGAVIKGDVCCEELFLDGLIDGNVHVGYRSRLDKGAIIRGHLETSYLLIHRDAQIEKGLRIKDKTIK